MKKRSIHLLEKKGLAMTANPFFSFKLMPTVAYISVLGISYDEPASTNNETYFSKDVIVR